MAIYIDADARDNTSTGHAQYKYKKTYFSVPKVYEILHVKGAWLNTTHGLQCSNCKLISPYNNRYFNFCPNCGADMRCSNESEPIPHWRGQDDQNLPFQLEEGDTDEQIH